MFIVNCRCGEIGRHEGLKIPWSKIRTGSSPVSGILYNILFIVLGNVYLHKVNDWLIIFIRFTL